MPGLEAAKGHVVTLTGLDPGEPQRAVMTVTGPVAADDLGVTLVHEHVFLDMRQSYAEHHPDARYGPPELHMLGEWRRDYSRFPDFMVLDDLALAISEISGFAECGGRTIVDATPIGARPPSRRLYPEGLRTVSEAAGVNVIAGCGYYIQDSHPEYVRTATSRSLSEMIVNEVENGIEGTGIRPGVIGEIGLSQPVEAQEWKVLDAACEAQKLTGLPLYIHPYFGARSRIAPEVAEFVLSRGVDPQKVNMCHMDGYMNLDYQRRVADLGVFISFDNFGLENYYDSVDFSYNSHDSRRHEHLLKLLALGYRDQLLISQDTCYKTQLTRYGGYGYAHILRNIVPALRHAGIDGTTVEGILVENPSRLLIPG